MKPMGIYILIFFIVAPNCAQGEKHTISHEQTEFSAEDEGVKHPIAIPPDVMKILNQDEVVKSELENDKRNKISDSWFSASAVHLAGPHEQDMVVMAVAELRGANVTTFWVFRRTIKGHQLVMTAPAHTMKIQKTSRNGLRDIELVSATAREVSTSLCSFDGGRYTQCKSTSEKIQ